MKMRNFQLFLVLLTCFDKTISSDLNFNQIRPNTDEITQQKAAENVIRRLLPENNANNIEIKINFKLPGNYFKIRKTNNSQVLYIEASNGLSACKAIHHFLKHHCGAHISWDGNQIPIIDEFPLANIEEKASSEIIYYQNVCTHSYSFTWWSWSDWRKHIDWIALSGISLTLAPFQEDIWTDLLMEYGMSQAEIEEHLAGPGFFAWQRMGNIRGWGGPLSIRFIQYASRLQLKMIKALNELGISVALPAFAGHLPLKFRELFPNTKFTIVEKWNNFPQQYCCPLFVDPTEPLFNQIGQAFLKKVTEKYRTNHIYFSDPFNEIQPFAADAKYLKNVSESIYSAMKSVDPESIWLLQGWMLVKNPFWMDDLIEAFLTAVPKGKILVLDLQSEQHPQYNRTLSFYGQPFIWCMLHNFGGTLGMHGSVRFVNVEIPRAASIMNSTMVGVGLTPEGIHQNYVVYEFALEKAWNYKEINHKRWIKSYAKVRYGFESSEIEHAWMLLLKSVYFFEGNENIRGKYTYCRRPSLKITPWKWYDEKFVRKALQHFIAGITPETNMNSLLKRDLVDLTRQFLQNQADNIYSSLTKAFKEKNLQQVSSLSQQFIELLIDLDAILGTHEDFLLGKFLQKAKNLANGNDDEEKQFEFNARNQITLWGPSGQIVDYATKQWNGIARDYYLPRWNLFFDQLKTSLTKRSPFNQTKFQQDVLQQVEIPFNLDRKIYSTESKGDCYEMATQIYHKWKNISKI